MKTKKFAKRAAALLMSSTMLGSLMALAPVTALAGIVAYQPITKQISHGTYTYSVDPTTGNVTNLEIVIDAANNYGSSDKLDMPAVAVNDLASCPIRITVNGQLYDRFPNEIYIPVTNANSSTVSMINGTMDVEIFDAYMEPRTDQPNYAYANTYKVHVTKSKDIYLRNNAKRFLDVSTDLNSYPSKEIAFMSARGLMSGVNADHFSPNTYVNRGQIATILFRRAGEPTTYDNDPLPAGVSPASFYARASRWAVGKGLMAKGANFNGETPITREQLALILYRLIPVPKQVDEYIFQQYPDLRQMSDMRYMNAFAYLIQDGIMGQGTNSIRPQANCTRAEVAAMLSRWIPQSTNEALYAGAVSPI